MCNAAQLYLDSISMQPRQGEEDWVTTGMRRGQQNGGAEASTGYINDTAGERLSIPEFPGAHWTSWSTPLLPILLLKRM